MSEGVASRAPRWLRRGSVRDINKVQCYLTLETKVKFKFYYTFDNHIMIMCMTNKHLFWSKYLTLGGDEQCRRKNEHRWVQG